eukprot:GGOE01046450.1.p2 GENE.GGOE01046450.1~~GGOE01046450.1.p2  ORF type:complete len:142 (-),score=0.25 GGOE01046450.1:74-499(-)
MQCTAHKQGWRSLLAFLFGPSIECRACTPFNWVMVRLRVCRQAPSDPPGMPAVCACTHLLASEPEPLFSSVSAHHLHVCVAFLSPFPSPHPLPSKVHALSLLGWFLQSVPGTPPASHVCVAGCPTPPQPPGFLRLSLCMNG